MTATILALTADAREKTDGMSNTGDPLSVFHLATYDDHVREWRIAYAEAHRQQWKLAAIAASLVRSVGGSPRHQAARRLTVIQQFCHDVRIDRQTFQRLTRTYKTFAETGTTGGTCLLFHFHELSFKHFEVATHASDPAAAVTEAYEKGWTANELARQLAVRRDAPPFSLAEAMAKLQQTIETQIASWPEDAQRQAPEILQEVLEGVLYALTAPAPAPLTKAELHALRWIKACLENFAFTKCRFIEIPVGHGGAVEVVGGAAGARIYQEIIGTASRASRPQVLKAVDDVLAGKVTALGKRVLDVARDLANGTLGALMELPPEAGGDVTGTLFAPDVTPAFDDDLPRYDGDPIGCHEEVLAR